MARRKKSADSITLQEHMESIASLGGQARAEKLSAARKAAIGRKGGKLGGKKRAETLSAERRAEIAKAAAQKRWKKK